MSSQNNCSENNFLTPKRKRLGIGRIIRRKDCCSHNFIVDSSPACSQNTSSSVRTPERCDSPALPCNQIEYMYDSGHNSVSSDIPCSPGITTFDDVQNWKTPMSNNDACEEAMSRDLLAENELSDEMFVSKLNQELTQSAASTEHLIQDVKETFDNINQSILCSANNQKENNLFDVTKDSFLLDIQTGVFVEENSHVSGENNLVKLMSIPQNSHSNSFYGLPLKTKDLFKAYRNIEKFYDWQEECLNLDAIKERRNLIYALPTSGGKTLVAEVLMLREVLTRKKNALFILPFVAIVQEKIWALAPFALQLEFLVEEYAGGKGYIPPKKRRKKNSIYIATIEKGLALIRSLIELDRLQEIGLIVVDELHLIGEPGRGGTLETLLTIVIFANKGIQIVGMSATISNLSEVAAYLRADVFQRDFRPVELTEYVKLGDMLYRIVNGPQSVEIVPERRLAYDYSAAAMSLDPDMLGGLVAEVVPAGSCLVFCPTKRNCENVASLLCKLQRNEMLSHRTAERIALSNALRAEGASIELVRCVRYGIAYHHAGLAGDERTLLEQAYRAGALSVVCCTTTLAAGVNLPARRVLVRAPCAARRALPLAAYRQMAGRAGRAGACSAGDSILICSARDWPQLRDRLAAGLPPVRSVLRPCCSDLLLSGVALGLAEDRSSLRRMLATTLLAVAPGDNDVDINQLCDEVVTSLLESDVLEFADKSSISDGEGRLVVSTLGTAAIQGCLELSVARQLLEELDVAARALVLMGSLHLLYLVTPHDAAGLRPDYSHYYTLYSNLDEEGIRTAKILGITEVNAIRMITGKPITKVPERVVVRFYLALMLRELWQGAALGAAAEKYRVARGAAGAALAGAAARAAAAQRVCAAAGRWPLAALLHAVALRLRHAAAPAAARLLDLPAVRKARALQLSRAGYKSIEDIARASADDLVSCITHLSRTAANQLISAARLMLIEKIENLRDEAEEVMDGLK